jgi:hypothetical protein
MLLLQWLRLDLNACRIAACRAATRGDVCGRRLSAPCDQIGGRLAGIECAAARQRLAECIIMFIMWSNEYA